MRVTSSLWVDVLVRRCTDCAVPVYVTRRGAAEAGAIFVRVEYADRLSDLYAPAPQAMMDAETTGRQFEIVLERADALAIGEYLERQANFDPDLWVVDIDHRPDWPADHLEIARPE
ncbi:MAG: DUF1491 family protein [Pseudomonadota bacterium]